MMLKMSTMSTCYCPRCGAQMDLRSQTPRRGHFRQMYECPTCRALVSVRRWPNGSADALWFDRRARFSELVGAATGVSRGEGPGQS